MSIEWEWDMASDLLKAGTFELSGNNSIATKIIDGAYYQNKMTVGGVLDTAAKHTISMKLLQSGHTSHSKTPAARSRFYCGLVKDGVPCDTDVCSNDGWFRRPRVRGVRGCSRLQLK